MTCWLESIPFFVESIDLNFFIMRSAASCGLSASMRNPAKIRGEGLVIALRDFEGRNGLPKHVTVGDRLKAGRHGTVAMQMIAASALRAPLPPDIAPKTELLKRNQGSDGPRPERPPPLDQKKVLNAFVTCLYLSSVSLKFDIQTHKSRGSGRLLEGPTMASPLLSEDFKDGKGIVFIGLEGEGEKARFSLSQEARDFLETVGALHPSLPSMAQTAELLLVTARGSRSMPRLVCF
jgi:hypothetical protein